VSLLLDCFLVRANGGVLWYCFHILAMFLSQTGTEEIIKKGDAMQRIRRFSIGALALGLLGCGGTDIVSRGLSGPDPAYGTEHAAGAGAARARFALTVQRLMQKAPLPL
jgi:hypothetical protein